MKEENICHLAKRVSLSDSPMVLDWNTQYYRESYGIKHDLHPGHQSVEYGDIECLQFWTHIFPIFYDRFVKSGVVKNMKEANLIIEGSGKEIDHLTTCLQTIDENEMALFFKVGEVNLKYNPEIKGIILKCEKSGTLECARCWLRIRHGWPLKAQVGINARFPDLCLRCSKVMEKEHANILSPV